MLGDIMNSIFFGFILVFATPTPTEAKIFWINHYPPVLYRNPLNILSEYHQPVVNRADDTSNEKEMLLDVIKLLNERQRRQPYDDNLGKQCARLFSSAKGNRQQRIFCIANLKRKREMNVPGKKTYLHTLYNNNFIDLTRAVENINANTRSVQLSKGFSTDYVDSKDLKVFGPDSRSNVIGRRVSVMRERDSDSSDSDSDSSIETKKNSYVKKPKRFQVINNDKAGLQDTDDEGTVQYKKQVTKKENTDDSSDSEDSDEKQTNSKETESSAESEEPVQNQQQYGQDSEDSSSSSSDGDNLKRPVQKKKNKYRQGNHYESDGRYEDAPYANSKKKEYYLQGKRLVDSNLRSGRRRLPHFLPKRFHWEPEDIHDLGYYWFNGPQGKYPNLAMRP